MNTRKLGAALAVTMGVIGLMPGQAAAVAFVNGSFEADNWNTGGGPFLDVDAPANGVTGWTAVDPAPTSAFFIEGWNNANGAGPTPFGSQWIALGEEGLGGNYVEQTVTGFIAGNAYAVTFSISGETLLAPALLEVSVPGSGIAPVTFASPLATSASWDTWSTFSYAFTADATNLTFRFTDRSNAGNTAVGLDNVSVAEARGNGGTVPEPGSLALLLTAGALCAGLRRKA